MDALPGKSGSFVGSIGEKKISLLRGAPCLNHNHSDNLSLRSVILNTYETFRNKKDRYRKKHH